ncbi:MAG TPA: YbhB/YbcL family Raf kinase inhibitor-like protein [Bryobacteraceae bacterium]|nr:YbhB/YbcL family Raf kinase inhibitor-like protein [Bryobacteraceae bacterium]
MRLQSSGFPDGGTIPSKYTHKGGNFSPPLAWADAPKKTKSFALIVDDPDAPNGSFVHWLVYNIPANQSKLEEGTPHSKELDGGVRQGRNNFGDIGYDGPEPPSGTHRYRFHLFALDSKIELPSGAERGRIDSELRQHTIGECELVGKYARS